MSDYYESDAEAVDDEDAEDAAGFTFFMSMADPSSAHESDNADAEVTDGSTDCELSDEGAISDYVGAEFDVGRLDGLGEFIPDDDGDDPNAQATDPSIEKRGGLAVMESAVGEKEGMSEYCRFDAEVVGESGDYTSADETASTYDEFDAEVMDDEDVEGAADVALFMSMTDKNSGRESDSADATVADDSTHSVISYEETIGDYGAQCDAGRMADLDGFVPVSDGEDSNAQPTGPYIDKRGGSAVLESAVVETEGLALKMPFLPAKEPAEDGDSDSNKNKEEEEGNTAVRVQPDTTKGHTSRYPVEMRRWPESVPTLSVVSPTRHFVQETIINTKARVGNRGCGQAVAGQVGVPAALVVAQLTTRKTTPASLVKPVAQKNKKGGVYGECCPVAACRQVNVPALVVLPTRRSRKRVLLGGVAGDVARAVHSDHSPEITFRSVNAPALVVVPPKAPSERVFLQERVAERRAPAGYGNNRPALAGRVNEPTLLVKPEKRSGRYFEKESIIGTTQQAASRDRSPVVVSRQVNRPAVLVVPLESRSKRLVLHGGTVVRGVGAVHRDCYYPTVLTQRNAPVVFAAPPATSSKRRFSKEGTSIVGGKARAVYSDRPPVVVSQHVSIMLELVVVQPPRLSERHVGVVAGKARADHRGNCCPVLLQWVHNIAALPRPPIRCLESRYGRRGYSCVPNLASARSSRHLVEYHNCTARVRATPSTVRAGEEAIVVVGIG